MIQSMYPRVASSFGITLAGLPKTMLFEGTSKFTYAFGATNTLSPMVIFPTNTAPQPIQTLFPILG
jgi:hypothetical protein